MTTTPSQLKTFLVRFNDFGRVHVIAETYSEVEKLFIKSGIGSRENRPAKIIEITACSETYSPIYDNTIATK